MNHSTSHAVDTIIIGAGLSGLVCALESLKKGQSIAIIDAQPREKIGGLATIAFGGMCLIDTPEQRSKGIVDSAELAYKDWCSFAQFGQQDSYPKAWAKRYVEYCMPDIYEYIKQFKVSFLPAVNWVERGQFVAGNSVPRYHILWGASLRLIHQILEALKPYEGKQLHYHFDSRVSRLISTNGKVEGCVYHYQQQELTLSADHTVIACGGYTGNIAMVKANWPKDWGNAPGKLLNGCHPSNDGTLHQAVEAVEGSVTHLSNMYPYGAGIDKPNPEFENQGLSLIPCKSALWLDHKGERIVAPPLVTGFDTHQLCKTLSLLDLPHSWQIMNKRIALKEFAISGCEYNPAIRDRHLFALLKNFAFGNHQLIKTIAAQSPQFIMANTWTELVAKMNQISPDHPLMETTIMAEVKKYDDIIKRGKKLWNDDQIRRILHAREWLPDRLRTCYPKPMGDNGPFIAIQLNLVTRKSLGGIKTDLNSSVLDQNDKPIAGLLAIGEAAGFGGGGANGRRSLEGTFLSGCILTARQAARFVTG